MREGNVVFEGKLTKGWMTKQTQKGPDDNEGIRCEELGGGGLAGSWKKEKKTFIEPLKPRC